MTIIDQYRFKRVSPGDPIEADEFNRMIDAVEAISARLLDLKQEPRRFTLHELKTDIASRQRAKDAFYVWYDAAVPPGQDPWKPLQASVEDTADIQDAVYLDGERRLMFNQREMGGRMPIPGPNAHICKVYDNQTIDEKGDVNVWEVVNGEEVVSSESIKNDNRVWGGGGNVTEKERVVAMQHRQSRDWLLLNGEEHIKFAKLRTTDDEVTGAYTIDASRVEADGTIIPNEDVTLMLCFNRESFNGWILSSSILSYLEFPDDNKPASPAGFGEADGIVVSTRQQLPGTPKGLDNDDSQTTDHDDNWNVEEQQRSPKRIGVAFDVAVRLVAAGGFPYAIKENPQVDTHPVLKTGTMAVYHRRMEVDGHGFLTTIDPESNIAIKQGPSINVMTFLPASFP